MRTFNSITPSSRYDSFLFQHLVSPAALYQSVDGGKTTDIDKALKTPHGQIIQLGYSEDLFIPHKDLTPSKPLSFNPNIPHARETALLARTMVTEQMTVDSTIYMDKFDAVNFANNSLSAFKEKYESLKQPTNE